MHYLHEETLAMVLVLLVVLVLVQDVAVVEYLEAQIQSAGPQGTKLHSLAKSLLYHLYSKG
jgi:hypothetical protein